MTEKITKDTQEKIQHLQLLEQNIQNLLLQKQAFQFELNETENALKEVEKTKDDVFRMVGQVMIKTSKTEIEKEFKQKKDILNLRVKSLEKQESQFKEEAEKLKEEVMKKIK